MPTLPQSDHDLLIRVDTTLTHMRDDFKSLTDTTKTEVADLKATKLDRTEFDQWKKDSHSPMEMHVDSIGKQASSNSRYIYIGFGILLAAQFVVGVLLKIHHVF